MEEGVYFKNRNQNKVNLSQFVNRVKNNQMFGMAFVIWVLCLIFALTPFFAVGWSLFGVYLIFSKEDTYKKENCYSYKGNLTELLITLHKFGFELVHESKTYIQLDLKRLFAKPKSIFLLLEKKEIKILAESQLIEAIAKSFKDAISNICLLYTSPSPRDRQKSRMPSSA